MQQCVYETKFCDISDLQKRLMQTWFKFQQNVIDSAIAKWRDDHLRPCVCAGARCFEHVLWNCLFVLCDLSEHFIKL